MTLLIITIYKLIFYGLSLVCVTVFPNLFYVKDQLQNFIWQDSPVGAYWKYFLTWDAQHYLHLSQEGYQPNHLSNVFYPLWPFLIRIFSYFPPLTPEISGLVLTNIFSIGGFFLFYRLIKDQEGEAVAMASLVLLIAFPGAIFFSLIYAESLFLVLSVLFLMGLQARRYWAAAFLSGLMVLTRPIGIFTLAPLLASLIINRERLVKWTVLSGPLLGLGVYFWIMHAQTGDLFAGIRAHQEYVSSGSILKCFDIVGFIKVFFHPHIVFHGVLNSFMDRVWFVWFLVSLPFLWRWNKLYFYYALPMGLFPAMIQSFMSYTRYFALVIPIFVITAKIIVDTRRPMIYGIILILLFALQGLFMFYQMNNYWAG